MAPAYGYEEPGDDAAGVPGERIDPGVSGTSPGRADPGSSPAGTSRRQRAAWLAAGLIAGLICGAAGVWMLAGRRPAAPVPVWRFVLDLVPDAALDDRVNPLALSPDASRLVYCGRSAGTTQLFLRRLDRLEFQALAGTEGAYGPFFSPDGDWIGFFDARDSRLKKVPAGGGEAIALCEAPFGLGAAWAADGTIFFAPDVFSGLSAVSGSGGAARKLTRLESREYTHRWPDLLPDGRTLLFTVGRAGTPGGTSIEALDLRTGERHAILADAAGARYLAGGYLLYVRKGKILVQPFDTGRLQVTGGPVPLLDDARIDLSLGAAYLSLSRSGTLVYAPRPSDIELRSLVWADRRGAVSRLTVNRGDFHYPRLAPDGRRLALVLQAPDEATHIWMLEIDNGRFTRLTTSGRSTMPLWTPDGNWVAFASEQQGLWSIEMVPADGSAPPVSLAASERPRMPTSWSPDGKLLCFTEFDSESAADIWVLSVGENRAWPLLKGPADEWGGTFSPDGRWLAYTSDEAGPSQVYVRPFPGPGEALQLSTAEGGEPAWAPDGTELFYRYWRRLMSVPLRRAPEFSADAPQVLFEGPYEQGRLPAFRNYDVAPDGRHFVLVRNEEDAGNRLHFVHGLIDGLRTASPGGRANPPAR